MISLDHLFQTLLQAYGPQSWWPGDTPFEVMLGAVLTQNTNWRNVERAIESLKSAVPLTPSAIAEVPLEELGELIRASGYFRVKARRLLNLAQFVMQRYEGRVDLMFQADPQQLRSQLLGINGIGPETADSILLYAGALPFFVVDAYTIRMLVRHAWMSEDARYDDVQAFFHDRLSRDAGYFNEFHALVVRLGKDHCRKQPQCRGCPLESLLPPTGPCGCGI